MKIFFKDHMSFIIIYALSILLTMVYVLLSKSISFEDGTYIIFLNLFFLICFLLYRYIINKKFYMFLSEDMESLQECTKDLGNSPLGEALSKILKEQYGLYEKNIEMYNKNQKEHLMFMNHWVHQMKTPVSVIQLYIQESEGEEMAENLRQEVEKLDKGLNMALYFARLDSFEKDFHVDKVDLHKLTLEIINGDKRLFIKNKVFPEIKVQEDIQIYTDKKWMKFVIQQIIVNGVKYSKGENKKLTISSKIIGKLAILEIEDEGVGIPRKDIKRVFDSFYTGDNGRKFGESTGMGLYIAKKVCDSLNHKVDIESEVNKGTKVTLIFRQV